MDYPAKSWNALAKPPLPVTTKVGVNSNGIRLKR